MGGPGSTRWRGHRPQPLVEEALALDLTDLRRKGALSLPLCAGTIEWRAKAPDVCLGRAKWVLQTDSMGRSLKIVIARPGRPTITSDVILEAVEPRFGGTRWYFCCPIDGCDRRALKLYLTPGDDRLGCRSCLGLQYRSVREHDARVDRLRRDPAALLSALHAFNTGRASLSRARVALKALDRGVRWGVQASGV